MEKKKDIKTGTVYYDHRGSSYDSREAVIREHNKFRNETIEYRVTNEVEKILKEVPLFKWGKTGGYSRTDVAKYLITTDLLKANKKIKELIKKNTEQFDKENPDLVIK